LKIVGFNDQTVIKEQVYYSIGGGEIVIEDAQNIVQEENFYQENSFEAIKKVLNKKKIKGFEQKKDQRRCLTASYKKAPQATDTLRDSISPKIGSLACSSAAFKTEGLIPRPSEPIIIAQGSFSEIS